MSKEITLEELAASAKGNQPKPKTAETKVDSVIHESPANGAVKMSPYEVADNLVKAGKMQPKDNSYTDAPLVKNAFDAMDRTLKERKEWISNVMMPIVEENAREMALDQELNEGQEIEEVVDETTDNDYPVNNIPSIDELLGDNDEEESEDEIFDGLSSTPNEVDDEVVNKKYNYDSQPVEEKQEEVPTAVTPDPTPKATKKEEPKVEEPQEEEDTSDEFGSLDELISDLDKEDEMNVVDDEDETPEEIREKFKKTLDEVKITSDPIDFTKFKIRKQAVNSNMILSTIKNSRTVKKADWALYHSKRAMTFLECSGPELDTLRKNISNANGVNGVITSLRFVYEHIEDANKPSFEQWTKLIRTEDIESLYYGIYLACYSSSNLIARVCEDETCRKTSLIDTDIKEMVVYGEETDDHEKIKKEFYNILNGDTTTENNVFESTLMQISDNIVISYSPATLYSTFIQFATLRTDITDKYGDLLNTLAYIDGFFSIDRESNELVPISIKEYPGNLNKTVLSRLKVYTEILKSLTNDQYNVMTAKLSNIIQAPKITYIYPKVICPECGKEINEEPVDSMLNLLFTRAQLAQIKSL